MSLRFQYRDVAPFPSANPLSQVNRDFAISFRRLLQDVPSGIPPDFPPNPRNRGDFNFDESKHRDGIYYHYTHCPIEKFARENGYLEVLPVGCAFDYTSARMKHAVLHRDQTLAKGGSMCYFWLVPDQVKDPR